MGADQLEKPLSLRLSLCESCRIQSRLFANKLGCKQGLDQGLSAVKRFFTDAYIRGLRLPGKEPQTTQGKPYKRAEWAAKGEGRLIVRVLPGGAKEFFYRYQIGGGDTTLALGRYDPEGKDGKTLKQIRGTLRQRREVQRETGDVKGHLQKEALRQDAEKRKGSFGQLLDAYAEWLEQEKKPSASEAAGIFRVHVAKPFPRLALTKANAIAAADVSEILARMVKAGLTRQVNKARAYLRAAFSFGIDADHNPERRARAGVLFGLALNPVVGIKPIKRFEKTLERTLTESELRKYWLELEALPVVQRATLRLNLALAAQRPTQLLRAGWPDFDISGETLLLKDSKGRGGSRDHLLPLTPFVLEQLRPLVELNGKAISPFTADGSRAMVVETLSVAVSAISRKAGGASFDQRAIRRTVETMLQKMGIAKEIRAHLLSHGRGQGVQGRHYERYDFLPEKRQALERWNAQLQRIISGKPEEKVIPLRA